MPATLAQPNVAVQLVLAPLSHVHYLCCGVTVGTVCCVPIEDPVATSERVYRKAT
jgi:hypothetical protein